MHAIDFTRGDPLYLARRVVHLYAGLTLYGASAALMVRAGLGLDPWDVFHQGVSRHSGLSIGVVSILVGALVLLLWWPLRQPPGLGTVSNVFIVGLAMDTTLTVMPRYEGMGVRIPLLLAAVLLNGVATGLYITARFGPGPRDGLMTGLHRRSGRSIRLVRTGIEVTVLAAGFTLGGSVGVGTVLYALAIGPLAQYFLRLFAIPEARPLTDSPASPLTVSVTDPLKDRQTGGSRVVAGGHPAREAGADPLPGTETDPVPEAGEPPAILP